MGNDIESQRKYYDERWGKENWANRLERDRAVRLLRLLACTGIEVPRMLDLGCGRGWLAGVLSAFGPTTGIDLSPEGIERARQRWPDVDFRAGNFFEMPIEEGAYDVVVSQEVIEHVEDQAAYIEVVRHSLRPGGYLLLTTPNLAVQRRRSKEVLESWKLQPIENWLDRGGLAAVIRPHFEILGLGTLLPGFGNRGILAVLDSPGLRKVLGLLRLGGLWDAARCRAGFGLHLWLMARKF